MNLGIIGFLKKIKVSRKRKIVKKSDSKKEEKGRQSDKREKILTIIGLLIVILGASFITFRVWMKKYPEISCLFIPQERCAPAQPAPHPQKKEIITRIPMSQIVAPKEAALTEGDLIITQPTGGERWEKGRSYLIMWKDVIKDKAITVNMVNQDYGEENPGDCEVFFGMNDIDPGKGEAVFNIPKNACDGRYKVNICIYNVQNFESSTCFSNTGYVRLGGESNSKCSYSSAISGWGDELYNCSAGSGQNQKRCYEGECRPCGGLLAYDDRVGINGCWYLAGSDTSCETLCSNKGGSIDAKWGDDSLCSIGRSLTGCDKCSTAYDNGWVVPYYNMINRTCYHNLGAGTYYAPGKTPKSGDVRRMCVCNY